MKTNTQKRREAQRLLNRYFLALRVVRNLSGTATVSTQIWVYWYSVSHFYVEIYRMDDPQDVADFLIDLSPQVGQGVVDPVGVVDHIRRTQPKSFCIETTRYVGIVKGETEVVNDRLLRWLRHIAGAPNKKDIEAAMKYVESGLRAVPARTGVPVAATV